MSEKFIERHGERVYLDQYFTPDETARRLVYTLVSTGAFPVGVSVLEPHVGAASFLKALQSALWTDLGDIYAMDMDPEAPGLEFVGGIPEAQIIIGDFRKENPWPDVWARPDLIIGNPPYGEARWEDCKTCNGSGMIAKPLSGTVLLSTEATPCEQVTCPGEGAGKKHRACVDGKVRLPKDKPVVEEHIRRALEVSGRHVAFLVRNGILAGKTRSEGLWRDYPPRHIWTLGWRPSFMEHMGKKGGDRYDYAFIWWDKEWTGPTTWASLTREASVDAPESDAVACPVCGPGVLVCHACNACTSCYGNGSCVECDPSKNEETFEEPDAYTVPVMTLMGADGKTFKVPVPELVTYKPESFKVQPFKRLPFYPPGPMNPPLKWNFTKLYMNVPNITGPVGPHSDDGWVEDTQTENGTPGGYTEETGGAPVVPAGADMNEDVWKHALSLLTEKG